MRHEGFRMTERKDRAWIEALRDAAHIGIADVKARRIQTLGSREQLDQHFSAIAEDAIASVHDQRRVEE
jgi:antitoxin ParD1/3/4